MYVWSVLFQLSAAVGLVASQDCDFPSTYFAGLFRAGQDGSSLAKCAFSGQQCCSSLTISLFGAGINTAINNYAPRLVSGFATAQDAVNELRNATKALIPYIAEDIMRPLLLSAVSPPSSNFTAAVNDAITDIANLLNGSDVNLTITFHGYINAVVFNYLSLDETAISDSCVSQAIFNHVYNKTGSVSELIELLQNISTVIKILKELPPLFDKLLDNFKSIEFTDTCLDVFASNYLCPLCRNQPFMCPGRCKEIITGCLSPFNQALIQLDTSFKLIMSIVKSLNGSSDSVTNSVNISHILTLHGCLLESINISEVAEQIVNTCNTTEQSFGKRSINEQGVMEHKRASSTSAVGLNSSLFDKLENKFILLDGDLISTAKETLCDPSFNQTFFGYTFKTTSANGNCSFGLGNVGTYNSTFMEEDIVYQAFNNPAGQYNYTQLLNQAEMQTYIITELFNDPDISLSMFNIFLPNEAIPTTDFLSAPAPDGPITTVLTPTVSVTVLGAQIVGYSLMLQCEVTIMQNITNNVGIVWSSDGAVLRRINVTTATTMDNSLVYTDSYIISQLSTSHDGRVIECEVINTHALFMAGDSITLNVTVPTPIVTISPSGPIQGAMVGSPQVINCTVDTVGGVESSSVMISWMGAGGSSLVDHSRVAISPTTASGNTYTSSLQFMYLMEGDEGTYTCNVMILETSGSQSVELQSFTIPEPVVSITVPIPQTVGQSLTLYCNGTTVRGVTSDVDIVWRRNNITVNITHVTAGDTIDNLLVYEDSYTISQLNISDDNAMYECRMVIRTYSQIVATDTVILNVIVLPQIYLNPLDKLVKIDNNSTSVTFICMAYYASSYYWVRDIGEIPSNAIGVNSNNLTLLNILPPDSGSYQCVAENEDGSTHSKYAMLTIEVLPPVVSIVSDKEIKVKLGERVEIHCCAAGLGADNFTYQWFLNDFPVAGQNSPTLVISAVSEVSTGEYQCSVSNEYHSTGQSEVVTLGLDQFCDPITVNYSGFNITWNTTQVGIIVEVPCTGHGLNGTVRRRCTGSGLWEESFDCFREEAKILLDKATNLTTSLNELNESEIVSITRDIAHALVNVTTTAEGPIFAQDIDLAVNIINTLNSVTETNVSSLTANDTFFEDTALVINNLLAGTNQDSWKQLEKTSPSTSQDLISGTEQFTKRLSRTLTSNTTEVMKTKANIVIKAVRVSNDSVGNDYVFPDEDDNLTAYAGGNAQFTVPSGLLQSIIVDSKDLTIASVVIRNGSSLRLPSSDSGINVSQALASPILSLQVNPPPNSSSLAENPIMMMFDVDPTAVLPEQTSAQSEQDFTVDNASCVFYDYSLITDNLNRIGGWSTKGLTVDKIHKTSVSCLTRHLTSFAVLVSIHYDERPPQPSMEDKTLSIISYIGCSISLVCLSLSIILLSFTIYKTRHNVTHLFIHLNLCIALALGLVVFIAGIENATNNEDSCTFVAALLQYLFTSAFCWMLCEGVFLYMLLVTVFGNKLNNKLFFFGLGWGPAIPIVAISTGIAHEHYGTDYYCWIGSDDGAIVAFVAPIVIIILINCFFLAFTLKLLWQQKSLSKTASNNDIAKGILKATIILLPLLGMTWIIGVFAVSNETQVFAWIFAILNSLQGAFIFILHVIRNKQLVTEIRERYNFIRRSKTLRRLLSVRGSGNSRSLRVRSKSRTSQGTSSKVTDGNKKMPTMSGGDITDGDFSSKDTLKDKSKVIEGSDNDQINLKTLKELEESVIPEHDVGVENSGPMTDSNEEEKKSITEEDGAIIVVKSDDAAAIVEEKL